MLNWDSKPFYFIVKLISQLFRSSMIEDREISEFKNSPGAIPKTPGGSLTAIYRLKFEEVYVLSSPEVWKKIF